MSHEQLGLYKFVYVLNVYRMYIYSDVILIDIIIYVFLFGCIVVQTG